MIKGTELFSAADIGEAVESIAAGIGEEFTIFR